MTAVVARGERTAALSVVALAVGVAASLALWITETGYRQEQLLGLAAVVALVYFDRNPPARIAVLTFAVPAIILIDVTDVFWDPTLGIVVQGALIGSLTALFAVGLALIYRANRIVNFAQGDLGAVPAIFAILLLAKDAKGARPTG